MLKLLDCLLTVLHLFLVFFNLFGWVRPQWRKAHFALIILTAASWFLLGIWFGWGFCPLTEWQWQVKEALGEKNLPPNFVEYFAEKISGRDYSSELVNRVIAFSFAAVSIIAIWFNLILPLVKKKR